MGLFLPLAFSVFAVWVLDSFVPAPWKLWSLVLATHKLLAEHVPSADTIFSHQYAYALALLVATIFLVARSRQKAVPSVTVDLTIRMPAGRKVSSLHVSLPERPGKIQCYNPATFDFLGEVAATPVAEVPKIVARSRELQKKWGISSFAERRRVLETMRRTVLAHADDICRISAIDTGKPRVDAMFGEVMTSAGKLDWVINSGEEVLSPETRPGSFTTIHKRALLEYAPLGVIGVIAPWNYPCYNLFNHVASGLFAGNAVVVKMSEHAAWSAQRFASIARACLEACGHDPDLVSLVSGFGDVGAALVTACDTMIFTGSPGIGKAVMKGAASSLTPLVLELGGKDPFIVCDDADLGAAVPLVLRGSYQNSGQNCVGIERVYVYESVYERFLDAAVAATRRMRVGPTLVRSSADPAGWAWTDADMGPITLPSQLAHIQRLVDDAVAKGARVLTGGYLMTVPDVATGSSSSFYASTNGSHSSKGDGKGRGRSPSPSARKRQQASSAPANGHANGTAVAGEDALGRLLETGMFYAPTVLADVTHDMAIANEEVFGPICTVIKVKGDSDDEAVAMANSTAYGLGASVFSGSPARANAIARRLRCGMVGVNGYGLNYLVQSLPFGGVGDSGFGRFSGPEGLRACCLAKSLITDTVPGLALPTGVPPPLQYPISKQGPAFVTGLIDVQFQPGLAGRAMGLLRMALPGVFGLPKQK